jgi:hypothetical protein
VLALAEFAQVPVDLPGMIALAVLSAGVGGRARVETHPGHEEPVNIYSSAALPPGSRKSSVHTILITPLLAAEKELASEAKSAINEARTARAVADKAARASEKLAADVAADQQKSAQEKELARQDAIAKAALAGAIAVPVVPRIVADDVTPEEAVSLLAEQGHRGWPSCPPRAARS